jgi:hypothetical protein
MTVEKLEQFHKTQPFRPFRINLADGRYLDIEHPEFLARTPTGRTVVVVKPDETFEVIDLLLVTSLDQLNGGRRKRPQRRG